MESTVNVVNKPSYVSLESLKNAGVTPDILWVVPTDKVACVFLDGRVFTTKNDAIVHLCRNKQYNECDAAAYLSSLPLFPTPCALIIKNHLEKAYGTKVSPITMGKMVGAASVWF